jgi:L,D-transpeptidase catalytic domain
MKTAFLVLFFSIFSQAQVWDQAVDATTAPAEFNARPFSESDLKTYSWMNEFTNVIVVNKSNEGNDRQTLRLYVKGKLSTLTKISSGRETFEKGCAAGQDPKRDHCSQRPYWSSTPVGYFDVDTLDEKYFSNLWQTWMPYAVFFESGIATHQAPAGTEPNLGKRASGGCIRMHPNYAPIIFSAVKNAGTGLIPVVLRDGTLKKTAHGDVVRTQGYKTLVIVQNQIK